MEVTKLARVILRSDGSVHIAFNDIRSIYATAENILELFTDPIGFIEEKSYAYEDSSFEINRRRNTLEYVLGLTLAYVNSDKQIVCEFPELFSFVMENANVPQKKSLHLDMHSFELEQYLSDEKSFLLRYFLEFTNNFKRTFVIKKNIRLRNEVQFAIIKEILGSFFEEEPPKASKPASLPAQIDQAENKNLFSEPAIEYVSMREYCLIYNLTRQCVKEFFENNRLINAYKDESGHYHIDKNQPPIDWDKRKNRKRTEKTLTKHYKRTKAGSAADVEAHIKKLKLFTSAVAPYIHTYSELDYYVKHSYHEVFWNGRPALIIDVNPDYRSSLTGITNRELMLQGRPPVYPQRNKEEYLFHLHHIGQHSTSPFAIIPEFDHNSKASSSIFHQGIPDKDLHDSEYEAQKRNFWRTYIEEYDKAEFYTKIPFLNSKHKKNQR